MGFVIPAIDIQNGKCVRLTKGVLKDQKVYYENPIDALKFWESQNTDRIHIVDLDGAFGIGTNFSLIEKMIKSTSVKIQMGGGIRDLEKAKKLIDLGVDRIIVGTAAVKNPDFITILVENLGSKRIVIDLAMSKDGKPAIKGWTETIDKDVFEFGKVLQEKGAGAILLSSVESDGAFTGPDFKNTKKMIDTLDIPIIAAGGVRHKEDIIELKRIGTAGVIVGKAFYEGKISYADVIGF